MRTIEWKINTGYVGATHKGSFEVEDDVTDEEICGMVQEEVWNYIELSWNEKKKEN
jgi:hypothetical protein